MASLLRYMKIFGGNSDQSQHAPHAMENLSAPPTFAEHADEVMEDKISSEVESAEYTSCPPVVSLTDTRTDVCGSSVDDLQGPVDELDEASYRYQGEGEENTDSQEYIILAKQDLGTVVRNLEKAVSSGDMDNGVAMLRALVHGRAQIRVQVLSAYQQKDEEPFYIHIDVETDNVQTGPTWTLQVRHSMTIFGLKMKVTLLYGLPFSKQRWIIGRKLPGNTETLLDNNVQPGAHIFLYVIRHNQEDTKEEVMAVQGFHRDLLMKNLDEIELCFTQEEYTKYLKETKLRQSSHKPIFQTHELTSFPQPQQPSETTGRHTRMVPPHNLDRGNLTLKMPEALIHSPNQDDEEMELPSFEFSKEASIAPEFFSHKDDVFPHKDDVFPPQHLVQHGPKLNQFPERRSWDSLPKDRFHTPIQQRDMGAKNKTLPVRPMDRFHQPPLKSRSMRDLHAGSRSFDQQQGRPVEPERYSSMNPFAVPQGRLQHHKTMPRKELKTLKTARATRKGYDKKHKPQSDGFDEPEHVYLEQDFDLLQRGGYRKEPFATALPVPQFMPSPNRCERRTALGRRRLQEATAIGWQCPDCTFMNPPRIPGCRMCSTERPADYQLPRVGTYVMDKSEEKHILELESNEIKLAQMQAIEDDMKRRKVRENRDVLIQAADFNTISNKEEFECPICFSEIPPGEGVRLQECLHEICRECLANHINISNEAEVKCPCTDGDNACEQSILDREIRQIVGQGNYQKFIKRSLQSAEAKAANTFHCLTPNCEGFCFYDDEHNFFDCPICKCMNCLTCKVVHEGQNCKEYQDGINVKAANDETARQTQNELQRLLREGIAMNCPQCGVVIQKKGGCPHMTCSVCRKSFQWTGRTDV